MHMIKEIVDDETSSTCGCSCANITPIFVHPSVNILKHLSSCNTGKISVSQKWFLQCANALTPYVFQEIIVDPPYLSELTRTTSPQSNRVPEKISATSKYSKRKINKIKNTYILSPKSQRQPLKGVIKTTKKQPWLV